MAVKIPPDNLDDYVEASEGRCYQAYDDATGKILPVGGACEGTPTIGIGHTGPEVVAGLVWDDAKIDTTFERDLAIAAQGAAMDIGGETWRRLDPVRKAALIDICFEIGQGRLRRFPAMIAAVRAFNWPVASGQLVASHLDHEVPKRAARNAVILLTGTWPVLDLWG